MKMLRAPSGKKGKSASAKEQEVDRRTAIVDLLLVDFIPHACYDKVMRWKGKKV